MRFRQMTLLALVALALGLHALAPRPAAAQVKPVDPVVIRGTVPPTVGVEVSLKGEPSSLLEFTSATVTALTHASDRRLIEEAGPDGLDRRTRVEVTGLPHFVGARAPRDGSWIGACAGDELRLFRGASPAPIPWHEPAQKIARVGWIDAVSSDGKYLVRVDATSAGGARCFESHTGKRTGTIEPGKSLAIKSVTFAPTGSAFCVIHEDGAAASVYDARYGKMVARFRPEKGNRFLAAGLSADGRSLAVAEETTPRYWRIVLFEVTSRKRTATVEGGRELNIERKKFIGASGNVAAISFSSDGKRIAVCRGLGHESHFRRQGDDLIDENTTHSGGAEVFDLATGRIVALARFEPRIYQASRSETGRFLYGAADARLSPDGKRLAVLWQQFEIPKDEKKDLGPEQRSIQIHMVPGDEPRPRS